MSDTDNNPPGFKFIGLALAIGSGLFIGSSFVFKKKGLLAAQRKYDTTAGESHAYLKSPMWWTGMTIMILGEVLNFVAYMFADAVLVTPMGALSVVVCAILSAIFLHEHLTLFGKVGCFLCIVGSVIIAINAPEQKVDGNIRHFEHMFIAPGFLTWLGICVVSALVLIFFVAPKYGKRNMLVYITVCSVIGGLSVSCTSGLGSAIILSIRGSNQFTYWFTYFLLVFVIVTLLIEINYLNKALELFNTAAVTPTYYVLFTASTIVTSVILSQGLRASAVRIVTIVFGFFTICAGIVLLQLSKMDPEELRRQKKLDRKSSMLMNVMEMGHELEKEHHSVAELEDPGVDSIRGGMGIVGSLLRAKSTRNASRRGARTPQDAGMKPLSTYPRDHARCDDTIQRYQLYDRPMPSDSDSGLHVRFMPGSEEQHGHHGWTETPHRDAVDTKPHNENPHALVPILENGAGDEHRDSVLSLPPLDIDGDMGDQSAIDLHTAPPYEPPNMSMIVPMDMDQSLKKEENGSDELLASPTGIVEHYYENDSASHPLGLGLGHRQTSHRTPQRIASSGRDASASGDLRKSPKNAHASMSGPRHFTVPGIRSLSKSMSRSKATTSSKLGDENDESRDLLSP